MKGGFFMPSINVNIAHEVISWVINQVNYDQINNKSLYEIMLKWKSGEKIPTFNQIEDVSKATKIPFGYFFLQKPPVEDLAILQYRTIDNYYTNNPSRDLIDTISSMESIQDWMKNYLLKSDYSELSFVGSMNDVRDPLRIANDIRRVIGIDKKWYSLNADTADSFRVLRKKLEDIGVIVMMSGIVDQNTHRKLNIEEFRAFTLIDNYAPLIFINTNDSKSGKLFSLLHETAHIWIGANSFYNDRYNKAINANQDEIICNAIAAELLVPNDVFVNLWSSLNNYTDNFSKVKKLAITFRCGTTVIARRALDNGYITKDAYYAIAEEAIKNYIEKEKNKEASGGDYYITAASRYDNRFLVLLDNSVREGKTLFTDAYRITHTNRKTFAKLIEKVRGIDV
jgi:Zn-dependent peptidase ImmA (M78 family)